MLKCDNKLTPVYLCNMFFPKISSYDLREATQKIIFIVSTQTKNWLSKMWLKWCTLWNNLPKELGTKKFLDIFKRSIIKIKVLYSHVANMKTSE